MRALPGLLRSKRKILAGAAAALLLGALHGAPSARQGCSQPPVTRLGGTGGLSTSPSLSADGRFVAFQSASSELDGDSVTDVFVYDRATCALELVSVSSNGVKGNAFSIQPSISHDGRFVAFISSALNLVPVDANTNMTDAFVRDRLLGVTTVVSVDSSGQQPSTVESATAVRISGNGRIVAFITRASTLVAGDGNGESDVFVRDLTTGITERVSISTTGQEGDTGLETAVFDPALSSDGRFVGFRSSMATLVPDDSNGGADVFVRDRTSATTIRATLTSTGAEAPASVLAGPSLSDDGRFVVFVALSNFVSGNNTCDGLFVRDLVLNATTCPALNPGSPSPTQRVRQAAVSGDGRFVTFTSIGTNYVAGGGGNGNVYVVDQTTGAIRNASVTPDGMPATGPGTADHVAIASDGQTVAFDSEATNLVSGDLNTYRDVFTSAWTELSARPEVEFIQDGGFANGLQRWQTFATPDSSYIVTDMSGGELRFHRVPPPPGTSNQAVVFQPTWAQLLAHAPIEARFRLGNSSTVRKRLSVLVHDGDFSDLAVCTFWLTPNAPMRDYVMRTHTTKRWSNATISFYAATAGFDGGFYRIDNVSLSYQPILDDDVTDCIDPTAPVAPGGVPGPSLLVNGDFSAGLAPWATFGQMTSQVTSGVFEFIRPPGTPAGVVLQSTGQPLAQHDVLTALFYLGNSSGVRKRVTVILHDQDFSDLAACTFWLAPGLPLSPHIVRTFTTQAWTNATFSLYPATVGLEEWIRFTDATLQVTPGTTPLGTECVEPGGSSIVSNSTIRGGRPPAEPASTGLRRGELPRAYTATATTTAPLTLWMGRIDLRGATGAKLSFESFFQSRRSVARTDVSLDGLFWTPIGLLSQPDGWTTVEVDLSAHAGRPVYVRLVWDGLAPEPGNRPDRWRVRNVRIIVE